MEMRLPLVRFRIEQGFRWVGRQLVCGLLGIVALAICLICLGVAAAIVALLALVAVGVSLTNYILAAGHAAQAETLCSKELAAKGFPVIDEPQ